MTNMSDEKKNSCIEQLWFTGVEQVEVREQPVRRLHADELFIGVECSAISAGTEMLVYRGQIPREMPLDATIDTLQHQSQYPLQYGYASVGRVTHVGSKIAASWLGRRVFSFQPHASHFITRLDNLISVPDDICAEDAVFLPNMETAVNLVQDGKPALGERVVVLGQGIVGLLLSSVLAQFPLAQLHGVDAIRLRRERALQLGVSAGFDPFAVQDVQALQQQLNYGQTTQGADLIYEVSGAPDALHLAIELSGFASRIVIGSWYGNKSAAIALGGDAHRNRLQISTSQVSSLAPELSGRWDKTRRFELCWRMLRKVQPSRLITHRAPLRDAPAVYQLLHQAPEQTLQAVFTYAAV